MKNRIADVKTYVVNNEISYFRFKYGSVDYKLEGVLSIFVDTFCLLRDNTVIKYNRDGESSLIIYTLEQIQQTDFWKRLEKALNIVDKLNELENIASKVQLAPSNIDVPINHLLLLLSLLKGQILKTLKGLSSTDINHLNCWKWHLDTLTEYFEMMQTEPNPTDLYVWVEHHAEKIKLLGQVVKGRINKL